MNVSPTVFYFDIAAADFGGLTVNNSKYGYMKATFPVKISYTMKFLL